MRSSAPRNAKAARPTATIVKGGGEVIARVAFSGGQRLRTTDPKPITSEAALEHPWLVEAAVGYDRRRGTYAQRTTIAEGRARSIEEAIATADRVFESGEGDG